MECSLYRYKDEVEILEEDGYDFETDEEKVCLKLQCIDHEDAGCYTVEIENSAGNVSKTFTLNVKGNCF